jgi:hypothetical protein
MTGRRARTKEHGFERAEPLTEEQNFLERLWEPLRTGLIEIRVLPNERSSGLLPRRQWFADIAGALEFAGQFDDKRNGYSVYFGVGKRAREGGRKQDVLGVTSLWADIDTVNLGWDTERCEKMLRDLPDTLRPSALVHSGGGLHAYWFLKLPLIGPSQTRLIELANAKLAKFVSGDDVGNIDRILRLPGSWNAKRGITQAKRCKVLYCHHWDYFDPHALMRAAEEHSPLFVGAEFMARGQAPKTADNARSGRRFASEARIGLEELWSRHVHYHATGTRRIGVNEAILVTTAKLHCLGWSDERIVDEVLRRVKRIKTAQAPHEEWDWEAERETIRKSLERWKPKWKDLCVSSFERSK